ncbi:DUF962 domain-containing protein [Sulfidibacter corallicola]|uniref:DUF962 domain-containing protein n=1 Tax=Sulfidibacter corallicola TaxID=2818388 RepID=A0A8A4TFX3_SULCO|nr:Mpo1-like protein [Sulfidibacter corallicola]QTD48533.1 DUF962 domain-containing protein [Sulfidibacter corallicola]
MTFLENLREQRWDDHRYYHHSRINQSLHFLSAISFLCSYVLLFVSPVAATLIGWIVAMVLRQIGHFFFEPKGYDDVNEATHEHKEDIKIGYNLKRKRILLSLWLLSPLVLLIEPSLFGLLRPHHDVLGWLNNVSIMWLALAPAAILFRTIHLFWLYDMMTGIVWAAKILTDPFHDVKIYHKSPIQLLKGELFDPMVNRF